MKSSLFLSSLALLVLIACAPVPPPQSEQPIEEEEIEEIEELEEIEAIEDSKGAPLPQEGSAGDVIVEEKEAQVMEPEPIEQQSEPAPEPVLRPSEPEPEPEPEPAAMTPRTITVQSSNWQFSPSTIVVKRGEDVTLKLVGVEGNHGFAVPGMGINQTMSEGATATVKLRTSEPGTYQFLCSVPCGAGHKDMRGTIVVQ